MRYELITPSGNLDVLYDYDLSLNYSINDILDLGKSKTAYSKTITLPGTPSNNKFFKQLFEVNIDNISFNPKTKVPIIIRVGSNDLLNGYLQLLNINITNKNVEYEVSVVGKLADLFNKIGDLTLGSIDLSEFNHYRTRENVIKSWTNEIYKNNVLLQSSNGDGYVYPYIVRGNNKDIESKMYVDESYPSFFLKTIIDKIINGAGYTYTSKFFNSDYFKKIILPFSADKIQLREDEVELLESTVGLVQSNAAITEAVGKGWGWYYTSNVKYFFPFTRETGTVTNNGQDLVFRDDSNQWNSSPLYAWTCAKSGRYDVKLNTHIYPAIGKFGSISQTIEYDEGGFEYRYQMLLLKANGQTVELSSSKTGQNGQFGIKLFGLGAGTHTVGNGAIWVDTSTALKIDMSASDIYMEAGDRVVIRVGLNFTNNVKFKTSFANPLQPKDLYVKLYLERSVGDPQTTDAYSYLQIKKASNELDPEGLVDMNNVLDGQIRQKDILLDTVKLFNLVIYDDPNVEGNLIIEPYDDFYSSKQKVLNWDQEERLDNDSVVIITPMSDMDYKTYSYTYTEDSDFYNQEYKADTNGLIYGKYEEQVINELSDKTSEIKVSYAPTVVTNIDIDDRIAAFFTDFKNDEYSPKGVKQRILFWNGLKNCNPIQFYITKEDKTPQALTQYPQAGMWDDYTTPINTLEFGRSNYNYFKYNYFPNQTLFEKFHKNTLNQIKDLNSKLMECTVRWTPKDMASFDFRDIVFLNGSYWRVNEIKDYNPINSDRLTTFILYKIIDIDIKDLFTVQVPTSNSSCPVDVTAKKVNNKYVYVSASGKLISSDCCSQLGGVYVDGVCQINTEPQQPAIPGPNFGPPFPSSWSEPWNGGPAKPWLDTQSNPWNGIGGANIIPIERPYTRTREIYGNTMSKNNKSFGEGIITNKYSKNNTINGDYSSVSLYTKNSLIVGDGIVAKEDNSIQLKNAIIKSDGTIHKTGVLIIDGGLDVVFPFCKTNPIEIIDGTIDSVRNIGGSSWARPIIDGNPYE